MKFKFRRFFTAVAIAIPIVTVPSMAQDPRHGVSPPQQAERIIDVSVNFSFSMPFSGEGLVARNEVIESGRRMLYDIAGNECKVMQATIATVCRLERLNVQSNVHRQGGAGQEAFQVSGSAVYKVGLK